MSFTSCDGKKTVVSPVPSLAGGGGKKTAGLIVVATLVLSSVARAADKPATPTDPDAPFHTIVDKTGKLTAHAGTLQTFVTPTTARWHLTLSSERMSDSKSKADSTVLMTVWMEDTDASGKKSFRTFANNNFKGRGGDGTELDLDNGLQTDGSPRRFKVTIEGKNVSVEVTAQDQGDKATPRKKEKEKEKKK